jgi:hypothetical protein
MRKRKTPWTEADAKAMARSARRNKGSDPRSGFPPKRSDFPELWQRIERSGRRVHLRRPSLFPKMAACRWFKGGTRLWLTKHRAWVTCAVCLAKYKKGKGSA